MKKMRRRSSSPSLLWQLELHGIELGISYVCATWLCPCKTEKKKKLTQPFQAA